MLYALKTHEDEQGAALGLPHMQRHCNKNQPDVDPCGSKTGCHARLACAPPGGLPLGGLPAAGLLHLAHLLGAAPQRPLPRCQAPSQALRLGARARLGRPRGMHRSLHVAGRRLRTARPRLQRPRPLRMLPARADCILKHAEPTPSSR